MEMQQELVIENFQHARLSNFFNLKIPLVNHEYKFYGALSFSIFLHINDLHESQHQKKAEKLVNSLKSLFQPITNESNLEYIECYMNMLDFCVIGDLNLNELRMDKERLNFCGYCLFEVGLAKIRPKFDMFFNIKKNKYQLEQFAKYLKVTIIIVYEEQIQCELLGCDYKTLILPIAMDGSSISVLKCINEFRGQKKFPILYMAKGNISSALNCFVKFFKKNPTIEQKRLLYDKLNELKAYPEINLFLSQEIYDISDSLNNFICKHQQLKFIRTECKASHCLECLVNHLKTKFPRVLETCYNEDMACICMKKISLKDHREICDIYKSMQCCDKKKVSLSKEMDVEVYLKGAKNLENELEREKEIKRNAENERIRKLEEERSRQIEEQRRYDLEIKRKIDDENIRKKQEEDKKNQEIILRKKISDQYEEEVKRYESTYSQKIAQEEEKKRLNLIELKKKYDENLKTIDLPYKEKIIKSPHEYQEEFILLGDESPKFGQASPQSPIYIPEPKPKIANGCSDENYSSKMSPVDRGPGIFFKPVFPNRQISPPTNPKISFANAFLTMKCDNCKEEKYKNDFSIQCNSENAHDVCNSCHSGRQNCIICKKFFTEDQLQILENYVNFKPQGNKACERCKRIINGSQQGVNRNLCKECDAKSILCCKCNKSLTQGKSFKCKHCSRSMHYNCNNSSDICSICRNSI